MTRGAFRGFFIFTACVSLACIALGIWQLQRHTWKAGQIAAANAAADAPPISLPEGAMPTVPAFTRLRLEGRFLAGRDVVIRGFAVQGISGSRLYAPFELRDGRVLIVQRGWTSRGGESLNGVADQQIQQIEGVWRPVDPRPSGSGLFQLANEPAQDLWTHVHPAEMAEAWGLPRLILGGYVELRGPASAAANLLIEDFAPNLFNRHLEYVATWWSLAAALMGIFGLIWWDQRRHSKARAARTQVQDPREGL